MEQGDEYDKVKKGDKVESPEVPKGVPPPTPGDPEFARQKALAEEIMKDDSKVNAAGGQFVLSKLAE